MTAPSRNENGRALTEVELVAVPLTRGAFAFVDAADYERVAAHSWYCSNSGYAARGGGKGKPVVLMHRMVIECGDGEQVDHIDGNKLNNSRSNLRVCSQMQNRWNRGPSKGQYKGVYATGGSFRAGIMADGKRISLGRYKTAEDAARAYDAAAIEHFGEFAWLNFPKENGRPLAEALGTPVVTDQGPSHHGDTRNLSVRLTITQRCLETFKTLRIFEEVFGHVPVKNVAGRFRLADGADEAEELCSGCGLYPARLNDLCVGCKVRSERL